jgi:hypothetical protein
MEESTSSERRNLVIFSAAITNCIVVLVTSAIQGWSLTGLHAAARNSARLSAMWFVIAFAAPGLVRFVRGLPKVTTLLWAWFAAHLVHFATVAFLLASFERAHVVQHRGRTVLVVLLGSSLVFGAALTAASHSLLRKVIHHMSLYAVFALFVLALSRSRVFSLRLLEVALVPALVLRLIPGLPSAQTSATSAVE